MGSHSRPQNGNRSPARLSALTAFLVLLLSGCAGGAERPVSTSTPTAPSASSEPAAGTSGPSAAATMVCGDETRGNIVKALSLPSDPATTNSWVDKLYTCTYALPTGPLVLSVKEASDPQAALADITARQRSTPGAAPIEGLANLGFPAFQTPTSAVFAKDNFVLTVDAAALPPTLGPHNVSRDAFAYQVATAVLACWSE